MLHSEIIRYLGIVCTMCSIHSNIVSLILAELTIIFLVCRLHHFIFHLLLPHRKHWSMVRTSERGRFMKRREGILASQALLLLRHALSISLLILRKKPTVLQSKCECLWGGARVVQWWKHSPPTNVAWVQIRVLTPYVSWVSSWFYPLPWVVFFGHSGFPLASKPNISTPNWTRNARPRISSLMCYL